ncbi:hypothetical protein HMPREF9370_1105 [Neisseria wadsworthii 9715]|uniref:Uncharacterized protein n=1 Tax=Neisseria wadsworthii 9715 TaxID=1030841 RepID=G4CPU5_9NEIS|nr:hypothetical protein HMPREF9370_1105 [Neisseria wadsworthii 9715]
MKACGSQLYKIHSDNSNACLKDIFRQAFYCAKIKRFAFSMKLTLYYIQLQTLNFCNFSKIA